MLPAFTHIQAHFCPICAPADSSLSARGRKRVSGFHVPRLESRRCGIRASVRLPLPTPGRRHWFPPFFIFFPPLHPRAAARGRPWRLPSPQRAPREPRGPVGELGSQSGSKRPSLRKTLDAPSCTSACRTLFPRSPVCGGRSVNRGLSVLRAAVYRRENRDSMDTYRVVTPASPCR